MISSREGHLDLRTLTLRTSNLKLSVAQVGYPLEKRDSETDLLPRFRGIEGIRYLPHHLFRHPRAVVGNRYGEAALCLISHDGDADVLCPRPHRVHCDVHEMIAQFL